jgi:hypothetical protein
MEAFTLIIAIAGLIISTGALVKHLQFREWQELDNKAVSLQLDELRDLQERNRLAIKNLNENFSKRVYEVLEELAAARNNTIYGDLETIIGEGSSISVTNTEDKA